MSKIGTIEGFALINEAKQSSRAGLLYAICGFALLSSGDAVVKTMADEWPAVAVAALRFTVGAVGLSIFLLIKEGRSSFLPTNPWLQIARGTCLTIASLAFFSAIYIMPLAETMAIAFLAPILTILLSGPILGERIRPAVWVVCLGALVGVALILRPNIAELGWPAILPLISALFFSFMMIANRASAGQGSALSMQVFIAAIASPLLILAATAANLFEVPGMQFGIPDWSVVARCILVAITASGAHWLVYIGTMKAGASQVAPAVYVQMLVAVVLGWWWFGDVPDNMTLIGAGAIIAAGLYLWRDSSTDPEHEKTI
ncbi:MAG: DMT family transporter [Erythrobacter sp.]